MNSPEFAQGLSDRFIQQFPLLPKKTIQEASFKLFCFNHPNYPTDAIFHYKEV